MTIKVAYSQQTAIAAAVTDLQTQLAGVAPGLVIYFASSQFEPAAISQAMAAAFAPAEVIGCSTAGEIVSGQMLKRSVVAMALSRAVLPQARVAVLENIDGPQAIWQAQLKQIMAGWEAAYGEPVRTLDPKQYVGLILLDGLARAEERVLDTLGNLTNIIFVGASAGDDMQFKQTWVYAGGQAYTRAAVLVLLKPASRFDFIKTQSFHVLEQKLTATKVDEAAREVIEFNGRPAAQVYAEAVGVPVAEAAQWFRRRPVGLLADGEPYVRSPQQLRGDRMVFFCQVRQGMELSLLEATDIVSQTRAAVEHKRAELGGLTGLINFHCILRTLDLEQKNQTAAYGQIFADIPTIGFSTYGETYIGHINQTSTMLVFA